MPQVMKSPAISLLEAGTEMYKLALYGMAMPTSKQLHHSEIKYAPVMGLLGASSELLLKACLVQANGVESMFKNGNTETNTFRFANEVIDEIRIAIRDNDSSISFIWKNADAESKDHIDQKERMLYFINKFKLLQGLRANGLHGGMGCSRDIAISAANDIYSFIQVLSQGKKLKAYLRNVPAPETTIRDREAIFEDLQRRISSAKDLSGKIDGIRNMFLVLPYIPEIAPDWIDSFERIAVAPPNESDLSYLVQTLSNAHSIYLLKNRGGKEGVPVRIDSNDQNAIPIAIQNIKRTLNSTPDKFNNDILSANTRLEENMLDLPIEESLVDLFSVGLVDAGVFSPKNKLTAQQVWPYVASAYSSQGTPRPCWFIIKECDEIDKLISYMNRVEPISKGYYKRRHKTLIKMLKAYKDSTSVVFWKEQDSIFSQIPNQTVTENETVSYNPFTVSFLKAHSFSQPVNDIIQRHIVEGLSFGETLIDLLQVEKWELDDKTAAVALLQICVKTFDHNAMVCAYKSEKLSSYKSQIRKAMFFSDIQNNGPQLR